MHTQTPLYLKEWQFGSYNKCPLVTKLSEFHFVDNKEHKKH